MLHAARAIGDGFSIEVREGLVTTTFADNSAAAVGRGVAFVLREGGHADAFLDLLRGSADVTAEVEYMEPLF